MDAGVTGAIQEFEGWRFDRQAQLLFHQDAAEAWVPVTTGSRALRILALLLEQPGTLVSKGAIMDAVWPDTAVEANNLTVQIAALRRVLDRDRTESSCIQTVPGRGYRFNLPVVGHEETSRSPLHAEQPPGQSTRAASRLADKPSIAVMAFVNMTGDPDQEYYSDGVADDIITELSRGRPLFVAARNSSFSYKSRAVGVKQAAIELGVRYAVEGSVRRSGGRIQISAQLIDAETGYHIWAERYDCGGTELLAVQDEVTAAVTDAVHSAVADAELRRVLRKKPDSLGAWEAYQLGLWHLAKFKAADNERAIGLFQRVIAQDETFVTAYVSLTAAYCESGQAFAVRPLDEAVELAGNWARKAAEIDSRDAEVQAILGTVAHLSGRRDEAWEYASLALSFGPHLARSNSLKGTLLIFNGQPIEGRNALLKALRLEPRDPRQCSGRLNTIAISHYYERDYAGAVEAAKRTIARYPMVGNPLPHRWLAAALGQLGRTAEAREALHTAMTNDPKAFDRFVGTRVPWHRPEDYEHMLEGLRNAGWNG